MLLGSRADAPRPIDALGVWLVGSACAWPALCVACWSLLLHLGVRWSWAQAGPDVLLGAVTGALLWCAALCACAHLATG